MQQLTLHRQIHLLARRFVSRFWLVLAVGAVALASYQSGFFYLLLPGTPNPNNTTFGLWSALLFYKALSIVEFIVPSAAFVAMLFASDTDPSTYPVRRASVLYGSKLALVISLLVALHLDYAKPSVAFRYDLYHRALLTGLTSPDQIDVRPAQRFSPRSTVALLDEIREYEQSLTRADNSYTIHFYKYWIGRTWAQIIHKADMLGSVLLMSFSGMFLASIHLRKTALKVVISIVACTAFTVTSLPFETLVDRYGEYSEIEFNTALYRFWIVLLAILVLSITVWYSYRPKKVRVAR